MVKVVHYVEGQGASWDGYYVTSAFLGPDIASSLTSEVMSLSDPDNGCSQFVRKRKGKKKEKRKKKVGGGGENTTGILLVVGCFTLLRLGWHGCSRESQRPVI